jgi:hypothetical protein
MSDELTTTTVFLGNQRPKSDQDIIRDAQREALGLPPAEDGYRTSHKNQMATDEQVSTMM